MKRLSWDDAKRRSNLQKHGLDFALLDAFDAANAMFGEDRRGETDARFRYPERRFFAVGLLRELVVQVVYAERDGGWHVISLRPASRKERQLWLEK